MNKKKYLKIIITRNIDSLSLLKFDKKQGSPNMPWYQIWTARKKQGIKPAILRGWSTRGPLSSTHCMNESGRNRRQSKPLNPNTLST